MNRKKPLKIIFLYSIGLAVSLNVMIVRPAFSQESLALTITPPLIKINMSRGGVWSSSVKIVNDNPAKLTVYSQTMDFESGEEGGVRFISPSETEGGETIFLSYWIKIDSGPFEIPAFQSLEVPFSIQVPEDANPGGHYAAILVGTNPALPEKGTAITVSSRVASLILLNIEGDLNEEGWIREFSTEKDFYRKPEAKFKVTFENGGNVHLQPVGQIRIYNMWDKERGIIPINQRSYFGNVLPDSRRTWNFEWKGEESPFEIGRYRAELVLTFGQEASQSVSSTLYFWVIPLVPLLAILGGSLLFFAVLVFGIKAYIKRAVAIAQREAGLGELSSIREKRVFSPSLIKLTPKVLRGPIKEAIVDLRGINKKEESFWRKTGKIWSLARKYYKFALFFLVLVLWAGAMSFYIQDVLKSEKKFEFSSGEQGEGKISSKDILKSELTSSLKEEASFLTGTQIDKQSFSVVVLNGSGIPRLAAETADFLEEKGFEVERIANADSFNYQETVIKYKEGRKREAETLSRELGVEAELKLEEQEEDVVVIVGQDLIDLDF